MKLAVFLAGRLITAPIVAIEKNGQTITLSAAEDEACSAGGGCVVAPKAVLKEALESYAKRAYELGRASCRSRT